MPSSRYTSRLRHVRESVITLGVLFTFFVLLIPSAQAWDSRPQITWGLDDKGEAVLEITFSFQEMSSPPRPDHYPTDFLIRYREPDDSVWKELGPIPIQPMPRTTEFTVRAKIPGVTKPPSLGDTGRAGL